MIEATTPETTSTTTNAPTRSTTAEIVEKENKTEAPTFAESNEATEFIARPKPRLLNLNVDDLHNFAVALHNQTKGPKKALDDLSDVNMDNDDEDEPPKLMGNEPKNKQIPDKFYTNLKAPFDPMIIFEKSDEHETCKENGVTYKVGKANIFLK